MLVSCGRPCIYIKIVWKISPLFMPWVCKHDLLSASCKRGGEVCWRLGLRLSDSSVRAVAICWRQGSLPRAAIPVQSPERMGSPVLLISWRMPLLKRRERNIYFISWGGVACLPHPHLEWLCNLCWGCVTTRCHGSCLFCTDLSLVLKRKTLANGFWESTKKTNMTQGFPINRD